ncbi:MAG: type I glyceraldehyde-3-phosphate dehydrogenase [Hyphomonadaceae bacterium]|nr:type I glyceraldehyde-3-phosphate dehydrogenase [Hyphomonadaceae bacterium]MBC6412666.1 type I glyceraldehyde-3-phosphate dehydrogenase [Hyphomonadaceae bacterium]
MTIRIGINGFGRIGRLVARAIYEYDIEDVELVAINTPGAVDMSAHLLRYDSIHGRFGAKVTEGDGVMNFGRRNIRMTHERDPSGVNWAAVGVDVVMECTGVFKDRTGAHMHMDAGAKSVLISAPGKNVDKTIVYGVNHTNLTAEDKVVSCASCTTNCLAPLVKVLLDTVGIERGFMTTVHAYTQDQNILDNSHKKNMYRARAAGLNMIPATTGAATAVGLVLPELVGKLSGSAVRVPTANVSMVDLVFQPSNPTDAAMINSAVKIASEGPMRGILGYTGSDLVSSDFNHDPHSSILAAPLTDVIEDELARVIAWYDNEWGFANRMIDVAREMGLRQ